MRLFICYILTILFVSVDAKAQQLRDFNYYYRHSSVSQDAKDAYARTFDVNKSDRPYSIIDSSFTQNDDTRPFYIYLIAQMLSKADGELRATLNIISRHLVEEHPESVIAVLFVTNDRNIVDFRKEWAHRMAVEIRITCEGELLHCFKKSRNTALAACDVQHKQKLEILYNMVRREMNLFQSR